jgi:hypothetical protein
MEIVDIRDEYQEETGKTTMELTDCDLGARHTMEYVAWLESKLKNLGDIGDVRNLLLDFADYSENDKTSEATDECVDNYLAQKQ